jgi:hypothetical protein
LLTPTSGRSLTSDGVRCPENINEAIQGQSGVAVASSLIEQIFSNAMFLIDEAEMRKKVPNFSVKSSSMMCAIASKKFNISSGMDDGQKKKYNVWQRKVNLNIFEPKAAHKDCMISNNCKLNYYKKKSPLKAVFK